MKIKELEREAKAELEQQRETHIKNCLVNKLKEIERAEDVLAILKEDYEKFLNKDSSELTYPQSGQCY